MRIIGYTLDLIINASLIVIAILAGMPAIFVVGYGLLIVVVEAARYWIRHES